ncbi:hydantoinase B/oxoprolinase family protein [Mesorhizobium sp. AD1-1]|uniref:hydantoinase B/oxoprolinase family protein n=1 Tax=Mesorhizobium sp. AD1-1 TaxID=2876621 RepID=UPI001CCE9CD3|nr:hydantoinase B/oxoprolinase family protein [Mesorhizobium sp. AD1-1]MBZ9719211.1 hydantoinase B/oxoprolinase family protein [Mesorhizobium sp. AD1-1]
MNNALATSDAPALPTERPRVHPLTLTVVRHKLQAIAEEMVQTMTRTCFSPHLNQSQDFSGVVLDADARVLAQAERVPIHMGAMPMAVREMARAFPDLAEGDVLMANDPYWGGSHLPDITLAKPVFTDGRLAFWVAMRAHQGDIGGMSAGGYSPDAREIWQEGLRIPPVRLVEGGTLRHDLVRLVASNSRKSEDTQGDVLAELAAVNIGADRLGDLFRRYGGADVIGCIEAILDAGEAAMRVQISKWKDGIFHGVGELESGGASGQGVAIPVTVEIRNDRAVVDFTECCDQVTSFINSPIANTRAAVYVAFQYLSDDARAQNDGSTRAIEIRTRPGSLVDPVSPAPVAACTILTASAIIEAVLKAMTAAAPDAVMGGFARRFRFAVAGKDRAGRSFIWHYFFNRGGAGANARHDGWSNLGVIHNPGGTPSPSIERTESAYPFVVEEYALRANSGGSGRHRGGLGGVFKMRYAGAEPAILNAAGEGLRLAPYGVSGGLPGALNDIRIATKRGDQKVGGRTYGMQLEPGDTIVCLSAGGGGCGPASDRAPDALKRDLVFGYVTPHASR